MNSPRLKIICVGLPVALRFSKTLTVVMVVISHLHDGVGGVEDVGSIFAYDSLLWRGTVK